MGKLRYSTLGQTWLAVLGEVFRSGRTVDGETRELLGVEVAFERPDPSGLPPAPFAAPEYVEEMRKVFFATGPNQFGHSYAERLSGPCGRRDLSDVIELLRDRPSSKRAVVTLSGEGDGKVPCINVVHFLRRGEGLVVHYFARGQDVFRKFYADAACIHEMAQRIASGLGIPVASVAGTISSAHVYLSDLPEIESLLAEAGVMCGEAAHASKEFA